MRVESSATPHCSPRFHKCRRDGSYGARLQVTLASTVFWKTPCHDIYSEVHACSTIIWTYLATLRRSLLEPPPFALQEPHQALEPLRREDFPDLTQFPEPLRRMRLPSDGVRLRGAWVARGLEKEGFEERVPFSKPRGEAQAS